VTASDIVAILGALTGLVGTAGGLWLTHRARSHSLRDAMYARQLQAIDELYSALESAIWEATEALDQGAEGTLVTAPIGRAEFDRFCQLESRAAYLLPEAVVRALISMQFELWKYREAPHMDTELRWSGISTAKNELTRVVRRELGVDALSVAVVAAIPPGTESRQSAKV